MILTIGSVGSRKKESVTVNLALKSLMWFKGFFMCVIYGFMRSLWINIRAALSYVLNAHLIVFIVILASDG